MHRRIIIIKDGEKLRNIADSLQITLDELTDLENTAGEPGVKQAAVFTAMALAWINLVLQRAVERKLPRSEVVHYILIRPFRSAQIAASVRLRAPNFCMMLFTWLFTVPSLILSASAIFLLACPAAIHLNTESSRSVI
jgi:hypothetical protein